MLNCNGGKGTDAVGPHMSDQMPTGVSSPGPRGSGDRTAASCAVGVHDVNRWAIPSGSSRALSHRPTRGPSGGACAASGASWLELRTGEEEQGQEGKGAWRLLGLASWP